MAARSPQTTALHRSCFGSAVATLNRSNGIFFIIWVFAWKIKEVEALFLLFFLYSCIPRNLIGFGMKFSSNSCFAVGAGGANLVDRTHKNFGWPEFGITCAKEENNCSSYWESFCREKFIHQLGNATLHLYPHFKPLCEIKGLIDYISTEISTSKQKKFSLVTFIDTPGLVDGEMNYPFDVDKAIKFLGNISDLIFVFFDPIGQALRKRTLNVVESLSAKHGDKIKLFLSKADEAGNETDRQKVLMQIVQELCKRPGLNRAGFDLSTIYIPNPNKPVRCVNQIEEVCKEIEKTINRTVQNTLNTLESDCTKIENAIEDKLKYNERSKSENIRSGGKGIVIGLLGLSLPIFLVLGILISSASVQFLHNTIGTTLTEALQLYFKPFFVIWSFIPEDSQVFVIIFILVLSALLILLASFKIRWKPTLTRKQKQTLLEKKEYVQNVIKNRKKQLYDEYLRQSVAEHEL